MEKTTAKGGKNMADNTAISAKKKMHMLLNERDRLSAYRCRIHDVVTDKNSFNE